MLSAIRAFAKSPFARILLALVIISFGFGIWNRGNFFRDIGLSDAVVKAGNRPPVTQADFKRMFDQELKNQEQRLGQPITPDDAVKKGLDGFITQRLASSEALAALMQSEGVIPSEQLTDNELRKIKEFFNPATGQFDKDQFRRELAQAGLTPEEFTGQMRDEVMQRHYLAGLAAGLKAPRMYGVVQTAFEKQGLDFTWFALGPGSVEQPKKPTDAEMNAFLKTNAAQLTKPEFRQLSLVSFSAARLAQTVQAPEADVQKRFDFEKDTLSKPETRTVIQVNVKDAATGAKVADQLKSGGNPETIAKAVGATAQSYPSTPKAQFPDQKLADAAFSMKAGDVQGPIQGDLGLAVVKVVDVTAAKPASLDGDVRKKIETEIKENLAKKQVYDQVTKYQDAHSGGAQMADAAKAAGVEVQPLPAPIADKGATLDGRRANLPPKVLQAAFNLPQGGESEVIDLSHGEYWVVRVDKVIPPALYGLDDQVKEGKVRDLLTKQIMSQELYKRLQAKADGLVAEIKKGKSFEAAAAEVNAKPADAANVTRAAAQATTPGQPPAYIPEFLGRLFQAKPGEVIVGPDTKPGLLISKLVRFEEPPPPLLAGYGEAQRELVTRSMFNDFGEATSLAAEHKIKPTIDQKQARRALGIVSDADGKPQS